MSLGSYIELRLKTIGGNPKIKKSKKVKKRKQNELDKYNEIV